MAVSPELAFATPVVLVHVAGGAGALAAGALALAFRKGGHLHRLAGWTFLTCMTVMAMFGAVLGGLGPQKLASGAGALSFYLVVSGWAAVRRKERGFGAIETGLFLLAVGIAGGFVALGMLAASQPGGELGGQSAPRYYFHAGIAGFTALLDLTVLIRGGVRGTHRIARHLWRMTFAFFIAVTTFFPQQPDIFVGVEPRLLLIPSLVVLAVMLFWLVRAPFVKAFRDPVVVGSAGASPLVPTKVGMSGWRG